MECGEKELALETKKKYLEIASAHRRQWINSIFQIIAISLVVASSFYFTGLLDSGRLKEGIPSIFGLLLESWPPSFKNAKDWTKPLLDTLGMSVAGTALAVAISFPLAFVAAKNISPNPIVYQISRIILNILRSVPELIMGIIFVAAVGFGALPGALALGLHSVGMVGKFFGDSIEHVSTEPIEAVRSSGATPFQVIWHGVLPQVLPQMVDITIYRWEYNFRASTVMGMVGAGGIGLELMSSLRLMMYQEVSALLFVILIMVTLVDGLGAILRKIFK